MDGTHARASFIAATTDKTLNRYEGLYHDLVHEPERARVIKTDKPAFDFLSFEEAERLINAAEPEWRTLILVALRTGLRLGERIGLQWADLDLQRGKLNVRRTIWRGVVGLPKGGRERTVDLPASAVEALKGHRHLCGVYVSCLPDGRPLTAGMTKHPLLRALRRAGVSRPEGSIGWHDLRHTYGSHLAMRGVALKVIQGVDGSRHHRDDHEVCAPVAVLAALGAAR